MTQEKRSVVGRLKLEPPALDGRAHSFTYLTPESREELGEIKRMWQTEELAHLSIQRVFTICKEDIGILCSYSTFRKWLNE